MTPLKADAGVPSPMHAAIHANAMQQKEPMIFGLPLKYASLLVLIVQNSALVLVMRYSRIMPGPRYLSSTAVLLSEIIKCIVCAYLHISQTRASLKESTLPSSSTPLSSSRPSSANYHDKQQVTYGFKELKNDLIGPESGAIYLTVPAVLYTIQNNLQYVAASNLDAATFQVTYQLKILTTALFSVWMLSKKLTNLKWLALLLLTAGVACVQLPSSSSSSSTKVSHSEGNRFGGLIAVSLACIISGLAGVYFEKILKNTKASIWLRNIQLGGFSAIICAIGVFLFDRQSIAENGFFYGYNIVTWMAIFTQALGGLIVAVVVKYADNILKGFSTSISIILSSIISIFLFEFQISLTFLIGSGLVIYATYLYGLPDAKPIVTKQTVQTKEMKSVQPSSKGKYQAMTTSDDREDLEEGSRRS